MALNIPSGTVHDKAREAAAALTKVTGHRVSQVQAIEQGLDLLLAQSRRDSLVERILRIGKETAAITPPGFNWDHDQDLYDEAGLPR